MCPFDPQALASELGGMDIYLLDQVLKGRIPPGARILDAGCGRGRNLRWFLRGRYDVHAIDPSADAIAELREEVAALLGPDATGQLQVGSLAALPFPEGHFDLVILNAVLHFAPDTPTFERWIGEAMRVLRPGGLCFARLTTDIGMGDRAQSLGNGRHRLPDGTERYLASREQLAALSARYGQQLDPVKTTLVEDLRAMTTWVLERGHASAPSTSTGQRQSSAEA